MKFKKEDLQALVYGDYDPVGDWGVAEEEIVDTSRWSIEYRMIFRFKMKFYQSSFSRAATECQDERPFEDEDDEIECKEVVQVEKVVQVWTIKE